jgi:hypothetical protein
MLNYFFRFSFRLANAWPQFSEDTNSLLRNLFLKNKSYLMKLCRYLPIKGSYRHSNGSYVYTSELSNKPYQVFYHCAGKDKSKHELEIRIAVTQKFWLRLLPQTDESELHDELILDDPKMDPRFVIHSDQPEVAQAFLKTPFIRTELLRLPDSPRLEIYRGLLTLVFLGPQQTGIKISEFENTLNFLVLFAGFYEAQTLPVKILPRIQHRSLCPYCREKLDDAPDHIHLCPRCGVAMHLECWKDNAQQCCTWGCGNDVP